MTLHITELRYTAMGKTYKREKQYKRAREDREGEPNHKQHELDRAERKRLAREQKRSWDNDDAN